MSRDMAQQLVATVVLRDLLDTAVREGLPALDWTITSVGNVRGRCSQVGPKPRYAAFRAWVDAVQAVETPAQTWVNDVLYRAHRKMRVDDREITVFINAEFDPGFFPFSGQQDLS